MVEIEWTTPAFTTLENLPQQIAFEIIQQVDLLMTFPEMGVSLEVQSPKLKAYRQIIVNPNYRVIYEFDETEQIIYIMAVQHCRQKMPSPRSLKRKLPEN